MKRKKVNYKDMISRLEVMKSKQLEAARPYLVFVTVQANGQYIVMEKVMNRKDTIIVLENEAAFNAYSKKRNYQCTVIIDDMINQIDEVGFQEVYKSATTEELKELVDDWDSPETEKRLAKIARNHAHALVEVDESTKKRIEAYKNMPKDELDELIEHYKEVNAD